MSWPQDMKDAVLQYTNRLGVGAEALPPFGFPESKTYGQDDWYVYGQSDVYYSEHRRYGSDISIDATATPDEFVRIVVAEIVKRYAWDYAVKHSPEDRDPKRLYHAKLPELFTLLNPAWTDEAVKIRRRERWFQGYDDLFTVRKTYRQSIIDNGQVEKFLRSKYRLNDKMPVEANMVRDHAYQLAEDRYPTVYDGNGVEHIDKEAEASSPMPRVVTDAIAACLAKIGQPVSRIPGNHAPTYGGVYIQYVDGAYHYTDLDERGNESFRKRTTDLDTFLYWVFLDITDDIARDYAWKNRIDGQDDRRLQYAKRTELMTILNPDWGVRVEAIHQDALKQYPFEDKADARQWYKDYVISSGEAEKMARTMRHESNDTPVTAEQIEYWAEKLVKESYPDK